MPAEPDDRRTPADRGWLTPQWLSVACAFVACALIVTYDSRLGLAAATLLAVLTAIWLYLAISFGSLGQRDKGQIAVMSERFQRQARQRQLAARRARELAEHAASGTKKSADSL